MIDMDKENNMGNVEHPKHYNREGGIDCIDEMVLLFGLQNTATFCKFNAWKYRYRAADKNGTEDLAKSDWYINKYKELQEQAEQKKLEERASWEREKSVAF